jgi:hypothetical protein
MLPLAVRILSPIFRSALDLVGVAASASERRDDHALALVATGIGRKMSDLM